MLRILFPYRSDSVCKSNNFLIKSSLFFWYVRTLADTRELIPMLIHSGSLSGCQNMFCSIATQLPGHGDSDYVVFAAKNEIFN